MRAGTRGFGGSGRQGPQPLPKTDVTVTSVRVPAVAISSPHVESLGLLPDGSLAAPKDPDRAGWFSGGALPGQVGPAVIAGHIDSRTGPAVFITLRLVKPGAAILVGLSDRTSLRFTVDRVLTTAKNRFPTDQVFGPTPDSELRLITCGGPYDRSAQSYQDNTIVFASLA